MFVLLYNLHHLSMEMVQIFAIAHIVYKSPYRLICLYSTIIDYLIYNFGGIKENSYLCYQINGQ